MKILLLSDVRIQNPTSGSEQVLYQHATGLGLEGNDVFAITRANQNFAPIEVNKYFNVQDACYSVDTNNLFFGSLAILKRPAYLLDKFKNVGPFSMAISHQPLTCFSLIVSGKLKELPLLYVYHSPSHLEYELFNEGQNHLSHLPQIIARKFIEKFCLRKSSKIMVLSQYMKEKARQIHRIPANHIVVNPGGVDLKRFRPFSMRKRVKGELGLPERSIHLLTVRNLEPRMGIDNLIKSIKILRRNGKDVHLTICGDGPQKKNLKKLIYELALAKDVRLAGFIPSEQLPRYYNAADFFILPTRQLEGFGLVTPESMACGTPVVGTPVGGTQEILSNFDSNFLCRDPSPEAIADTVQKILKHYYQDQDRYKDLRAACRRYVKKNYSWKRHINQLKIIINEMLGSDYNNNPS
jgi:glycosyltransferase involved in cell wall biosynthesis